MRIQRASERPLLLRRRNGKENIMADRNEKDLDCIELDFDVVPTETELAEAEKNTGGEE